jgi:tetratricopeptide (TPR) repeat protein
MARDGLAQETIKILDEVLKERPKFPIVHYWLGLLRKSLGDTTAAESAFRTAFAQNKNLLEAEREIRLIEMRRTRGSQSMPVATEPKPQPGSAARTTGKLLDRILKR